MNNENSQAQAKSHAGGNDKLGINFAWPKVAFYTSSLKHFCICMSTYISYRGKNPLCQISAYGPVNLTQFGQLP